MIIMIMSHFFYAIQLGKDKCHTLPCMNGNRLNVKNGITIYESYAQNFRSGLKISSRPGLLLAVMTSRVWQCHQD